MKDEHSPANASTATIAHFGGVRESLFLALSSLAPTGSGYRRSGGAGPIGRD
jgi:hypothetical protein